MKKLFVVIAFIFVFTLQASAEEVYFDRNLKVGDRGVDVKNLQIVLNSNPDTQLAVSGPGSPDNETEYFGSLTYRAVIKFQELYRDEILTPLGLTEATGYVGPSTRTKLNELAPSIFNGSTQPDQTQNVTNNTDSSSGSGGQSDLVTGIATDVGTSLLTEAISNYLSDKKSLTDFANSFLPFGGQILEVFPCPCSGNVKLTVGPPKGGDFMLEPSSIIYDYGNVSTPGVWVLGLYAPGGACLIPSGDGCAPLPNNGTIYSIGTSAY